MKSILLAAALAATLAACGPAPGPTSSGKITPPPAATAVIAPAPPVVAPPPAPVTVVKATAKRPGSAERAAYAKAKRNAAIASCLRGLADYNGDLYVKHGRVVGGAIVLAPGIRAKEVTRAQCAKEVRPSAVV